MILPLVSETAEAVQDEILNGRPASDYSKLFLRHSAPAYALCSASAIGDMFKRCLCLDTSNLKECALSFKGIELGRKELM